MFLEGCPLIQRNPLTCPHDLLKCLFENACWSWWDTENKSWFSVEGDEDSNFSLFRVRRFTESPGPLHWIAFPVEILTRPLIHWIPSPLFTENPFFSLKRASSHPLPKNRLWEKNPVENRFVNGSAISPNVSPPRPGIDRRRHTHEQDLSNRERVPFPNLWPANVEGLRSCCWAPGPQCLRRERRDVFIPVLPGEGLGRSMAGQQPSIAELTDFGSIRTLTRHIDEEHLNFIFQICISLRVLSCSAKMRTKKSAVSWSFLRKSAPPKCCKFLEKRKSAKINEKGSVCRF